MNHAPTPWYAYDLCNDDENMGIWGADGALLAFTMRGGADGPMSQEQELANAFHICHCVNLHDELVEALEATLPALIRLGDFVGNVDEGGASGMGRIDRCALILQVRDAIAKAEARADHA
jgi:hypothetical protein